MRRYGNLLKRLAAVGLTAIMLTTQVPAVAFGSEIEETIEQESGESDTAGPEISEPEIEEPGTSEPETEEPDATGSEKPEAEEADVSESEKPDASVSVSGNGDGKTVSGDEAADNEAAPDLSVDNESGAFHREDIHLTLNKAGRADIERTESAAADGNSGDWSSKVNDDDTVTITKYKGSDGSVTIPDNIDGKDVTVIADGAFIYNTSIQSVTIPATVTEIGTSAFFGCSGLETVTFAGASQLRGIGNNAFYECKGLKAVTIPATVTNIGENAFNGCSALGSVTFAGISQLKNIENYAFQECGMTAITIPKSVTEIGVKAFMDCAELTDITFESNSQLESIGSYAFYECGFSSLVLPCKGLGSIGHYALYRYNTAYSVYCMSETQCEINGIPCGGKAKVYVLGDRMQDWKNKPADKKYSLITTIKKGDNVETLTVGEASKTTVDGKDYYVSGTSVPLTGITTDLTSDHVYLVNDKEELTVTDGAASLILPDGKTEVTVSAKKVTSITRAEITLEATEFIYDGSEKKPEVTSVKIGDTVLDPETDYTVSYSDNLKPGKATVTVAGKGNYGEKATAVFNIKGPDIGIPQKDGVYELSTVDHIEALSAYSANNNCSNLTFRLMNDIAFNSATVNNHKPINRFAGTFDGNGKTISGMNIYTEGVNCAGFFNALSSNGEVKNLTMKDCTLTGVTDKNGIISQRFGVIVGSMAASWITDCSVINCRVSCYDCVGGVVGGSSASTGGEIQGCTVRDCEITAHNSNAGGVAAYLCRPVSKCIVTGCTITGHQYVGGIAAELSNASVITDCRVADCRIKNTAGEYMYGAIVGQRTNKTITGCIYQADAPIKGVGTDADSSGNYVGDDTGCTRVYAVHCDENTTASYVSGEKTDIGPVECYSSGAQFTVSHNSPPEGYEFDKYIVKDVNGNDITDTALNGTTLTLPESDVTVEAAFKFLPGRVSSVVLNKTGGSVQVGGTLQLKATVKPDDAFDKAVTWKSSNTKIATVTSGGLVKGVAAGTANITVTTRDLGRTATCKVTVTAVPVKSVALNKTTATIVKGKTLTLTATVAPSNATNKGVTWASSNTKVATVSTKGVVKAVDGGSAVITVTTADGKKTAKCTVKVIVPVTGVKLNKTKANVARGYTMTLTPTITPSNATNKAVTWKSSNTKIATVTSKGVVKGIKNGTVNITVTTTDGKKTATCKVTVVNPTPVKSVKLNKTKASVVKGYTITLTPTVSPSNATNKAVTWKSSNTKIATVTSAGVVKGVKAGTANITVTTIDGKKTAVCAVTVTNPIAVKSVKLNAAKATVAKGKTYTLKATINPTNATNKAVSWKSSNTKIATVTSKGVVKGIAKGSAKITVTTTDGKKTAVCTVTVK